MKNSRLEQLFAFLKEDPNDPFLIYAIATEYLKSDLAKAEEYFLQLLKDHPGYTGTYYHAGKLFQSKGDRKKAEEIFLKGIRLCREKRELKAMNELQSAYNELMDEE